MQEDRELDLSIAQAAMEEKLLMAAFHDPLSNYVCEQDHFIKYAPAWEVQAWRDWNKSKRETMRNRFASNDNKTWRQYGEVPGYIEMILTAQDPLFFKNSKTRNAFFRRNNLFGVAEAV
jgi:hypothetical protein